MRHTPKPAAQIRRIRREKAQKTPQAPQRTSGETLPQSQIHGVQENPDRDLRYRSRDQLAPVQLVVQRFRDKN